MAGKGRWDCRRKTQVGRFRLPPPTTRQTKLEPNELTKVAGTDDFPVKTLRILVLKGRFPPPIRFSRKLHRWRRIDVDAFIVQSLGTE
jgi:hypothetical protein